MTPTWLLVFLVVGAVNYGLARLLVHYVKRWERRTWERLRKELPPPP